MRFCVFLTWTTRRNGNRRDGYLSCWDEWTTLSCGNIARIPNGKILVDYDDFPLPIRTTVLAEPSSGANGALTTVSLHAAVARATDAVASAKTHRRITAACRCK